MYILNRPMEIMILIGLSAVIGAVLFMNGLSTGGIEFPTGLPSFESGILSIITGIMPFLGVFEIPLALAFFGSAAGLFLGKGWGWTMSRTLQILGIVFGFGFLADAGGNVQTMGLYAVSMAISGVVIGYLYAPEIREFYGKNIVEQSPTKQRRRKKQEISDEEEEGQEPSAAEVE
ncbi:MAG TPA: hypothetical protein VGQ03_06670 [Nitrososphaera sp.]|jgi:hypothetical protein|nr:hypothetical protein [Nitrososphaera sp.]